MRQIVSRFGKIVAMARSIKKLPGNVVKESAAAYKSSKSTLRVSASIKDKPAAKSATIKKLVPVSKKENTNAFTQWLGGDELLPFPIQSDFDMISAGSDGISKASVDELATHLGISRKTMAEDIFDLSVKTLERKGLADKLDKKTSSHAIEIARVMQHAFEVFEDEEKVKRWINKENRALNGKKPIAFFDTLSGLNIVNDILGRIEEGVYS